MGAGDIILGEQEPRPDLEEIRKLIGVKSSLPGREQEVEATTPHQSGSQDESSVPLPYG